MTEQPDADENDREQLLEMLFETLEMKKAYIAIDAVMALFAHGRTNGLVIDSGVVTTTAVPIKEGILLQDVKKEIHLAGDKLNVYAQKVLQHKKYDILSGKDGLKIAEDIKSCLCFVAEDYD